MMFRMVIFFVGLLLSFSSQAALHTEVISYEADGIKMQGYLAYEPSIKGKRPAVLVVHEWWGHNEYARKRARMLADMGYIALAVDMYGDAKQASHPKQAGEFSRLVKQNMSGAKKRFLAAKALLDKHPLAEQDNVAAIGYCFGGGIVLEMARMGVDLKGVVSFHGSLGTNTPAQKGRVKGRVLVLNGGADPFVKAESISAFKREMQQAEIDFEFISYPGARHAFTNPEATGFGKQFGIPLEYHAVADRASWAKMQLFFNQLFN